MAPVWLRKARQAKRKRSRSLGVSVLASLRIRTISALVPITGPAELPWCASMIVSLSLWLGVPYSPATTKGTQEPSAGSTRVSEPAVAVVSTGQVFWYWPKATSPPPAMAPAGSLVSTTVTSEPIGVARRARLKVGAQVR